MQESPKYLVAKGRDADAIKVSPVWQAQPSDSTPRPLISPLPQVLEYIAKHNGVSISLTLEKLEAVSKIVGDGHVVNTPLTNIQLVKRAFSRFNLSHVKPLFSTRRLATNTSITILLWGMIVRTFVRLKRCCADTNAQIYT